MTVDEPAWLGNFEANRFHLRQVAYRMLGSYTDADDAVQETWLRVDRADVDGVEDLKAWLTTILARVCLDRLRARRARGEEPVGERPVATLEQPEDLDPEHHAVVADAVGSALLIVLDQLRPAERVAFVLHDVFAVPFDVIGPIVERSPEAARQLASRARRRVQDVPASRDVVLARQRELVEAFVAASREGDFAALLAVLDPDAVFRADDAALQLGAPHDAHGAEAVARAVMGRAYGAQVGLIDGDVGLFAAPGGRPLCVFQFVVAAGHVAAINMVADPVRVSELTIAPLAVTFPEDDSSST